MNRWSLVPPRRINRVIQLLEVIKQNQRNNAVYDSYVSGRRRSLSPTFIRKKYPLLEYSDSEYDSESSDKESVSSNDSPIELPPPHKRQKRSSSRDSRDYQLKSTSEGTDDEDADDIRDEILSPKSKQRQNTSVNRGETSEDSDNPGEGPSGSGNVSRGPGGSGGSGGSGGNRGPGGSGGVSGGSIPFEFGKPSRQMAEY